MPSSHKPRKGARKSATPSGFASSQESGASSSRSGSSRPAIPLLAFLWPAKRSSQWVVLPLLLMVVGLFRWATGLWGYSGYQTPPMHGDFEAQRHWMEITQHLPVSQWYFYDLQYWGLDYPPLTAYHSWLLGVVGSLINPAWFALDASRGFESEGLKLYMRATALVSEYFTYVPAVIVFCREFGRLGDMSTWESSAALAAVLMQPATMLIDHGHFQYNTVMLGFFVASLSSLVTGRYLWGCVYFVGALCFKQMALYYAPAVFAFLLGACLQPRIRPGRLTAIAIVTALSFAVMFAPLLVGAEYDFWRQPKLISKLTPPYLYELATGRIPVPVRRDSYAYPAVLQLTQAIHRIFPLARGLFEDKVANLWCALHTVYKLNYLSVDLLSRLSLAATLASILPACFVTFIAPRKRSLPYAFAACAWGFFLCSFQVHEKSVLLPLLPMTLLLGGKGGLGPETVAWVGFANMLASWTMYPLLKRDELGVPYLVLNLLWAYLLGLPPASLRLYMPSQRGLSQPTKVLHGAFYALMLAWHAVEATVPPPNRKPDLWVVLNCVLGAAGFGVLYLWCNWKLLQHSGLLRYLQRSQASGEKAPAAAGAVKKPAGSTRAAAPKQS